MLSMKAEPMENPTQVIFRAEGDLHRQAKIKAAAWGVSLASVLRRALREWVEEGEEEANANS